VRDFDATEVNHAALQLATLAEIFNLTRSVKSHGEENLSVNRLHEHGHPSSFTEDVKVGVIKFDKWAFIEGRNTSILNKKLRIPPPLKSRLRCLRRLVLIPPKSACKNLANQPS
jgi:hypothetical protein